MALDASAVVDAADDLSHHKDAASSRGMSPRSPRSAHFGPDADVVPPLRHARTTFRSPRRSTTSQQYNPNSSRGRRWQPGGEPGIDPNAALPGTLPQLQADCDITLTAFGPDSLEVFFYDNKSLSDLMHDLSNTKPAECKWINVNGLSWDVISALAKAKKFHRLAIEDVLSRKNRTKADWYTDHAYIVLPLQKLVHGDEHRDTESDGHKKAAVGDILGAIFRRRSSPRSENALDNVTIAEEKIDSYATSSALAPIDHDNRVLGKTLQRFHGGVNEERIEYMEQHSALESKGLRVCIEQVSIFLMADNTVVSFFEHSAQEIESPILSRLNSADTILRRSGDASMMVQAILDGIVDLALPVATAYHDAIDELELSVLTSPEVHHTRSLYILQSEVSQLRGNIAPISGLIEALRDHAKSTSKSAGTHDLLQPSSQQQQLDSHGGRKPVDAATSVFISPLARTYLADVADHVAVVTDNFEQMRRASDNMTDLIFNTVSAIQNESMRQLTVATIVFMPLTVITGYFGMNFAYFEGVQFHSDAYFWSIALPVVAAVSLYVLRDGIFRWFTSRRARIGITVKRKRRAKAKLEKEMNGHRQQLQHRNQHQQH